MRLVRPLRALGFRVELPLDGTGQLAIMHRIHDMHRREAAVVIAAFEDDRYIVSLASHFDDLEFNLADPECEKRVIQTCAAYLNKSWRSVTNNQPNVGGSRDATEATDVAKKAAGN